jgi:hypothetical protein
LVVPVVERVAQMLRAEHQVLLEEAAPEVLVITVEQTLNQPHLRKYLAAVAVGQAVLGQMRPRQQVETVALAQVVL